MFAGLFAAFAPYRMLAFAIAFFAIVGGAFMYGHHTGYKSASDAAAGRELAAVQLAIKQAQDIAIQDAAISAANIQQAEKIKTVTRTIIRTVHDHEKANPLPAVCALDAERMRSIADAIAGKISAPASPANSALSHTPAASK